MEDTALGEALGARMPGVFDLAPEARCPLAPMRAGTGEKLAGREVARMRRYDVKKAGFGVGVAERFEGIEVGGRRCS